MRKVLSCVVLLICPWEALTHDTAYNDSVAPSPTQVVSRAAEGDENTAERRKQHIVSSNSAPVTDAVIDPTTLAGKVLVGYQGWFNCEGDNAQLGWKHWARNRRQPVGPKNITIDLWPDVSELDADERYSTQFRHADGSSAEIFSSANRKTVIRHFRWMREYGIDGAFLQRFATNLRGHAEKRNVDVILSNVRIAARQNDRVWAVMYDLSGLKAGEVSNVQHDWSVLSRDQRITSDSGYIHHHGQPLVAVWGIGFSDNRKYSLRECDALVTQLKAAGNAVMLGVPSFWRQGTRDAVNDPLLHHIIRKADIVCPWTVGRYRTPDEASRHASQVWKTDLTWCKDHQLDFLPVVFPGFSWSNLHGGPVDQIPRLKGEFLWSQVEAAERIGCSMAYIAMFDEVDEGTAIFKCTNDPPVGQGAEFLTYEGLPSDHYLKLAGRANQLFRRSAAAAAKLRSR